MFSFERLLFNIINDSRSHIEVLKQVNNKVNNDRAKGYFNLQTILLIDYAECN